MNKASANLPWVESPFFEEIIKTKSLSEHDTKLVREYHDNGYVVIPDFLPKSLVDEVRKDAQEKAFNPRFEIKTYRNETKVQDFWQYSKASRELAVYQPLLDILKMLYDREPVPFQTLNFSVGSQQRAHSDTIHFSSLPARFMCGVWVALEDITEENGPVFYYPGSQRLPEYDFSTIKNDAQKSSYEDYKEYEDFIEKIVNTAGIEKKKFLAKKGDLLIWASNIIHGGSPVTREGASRWSQVTHYFFEDCYYYTPMLSNMVTHELYLRNDLINIKTDKRAEQSYNGVKLNMLRTQRMLYILNNSVFRKMPGAFKALGKLF
ncbi:MAG TPA: phytanoyl-CoA dioxygenase family protein [Mucilaginibacter sp.]|nr:phytanoyl-CoA dioxygenase family protein [Mucilaginibacter sp.]